MSRRSARSLRPNLPAILEALLCTVLFSLIGLYSARRIWDIDVFWHIVVGRVFLEQGRLVDQDMLSAIDPAAPWASLQWGYQVIVALLDRWGGLPLIRFVHGAIQFAAFALFYATCRLRLRMRVLPAATSLALLCGLYADRFRERPHVINLLFEVLMLPLLISGPGAFTPRALLLTALLSFVWANIHAGGALTFLIIAAAFPVAALIELMLRVKDAGPRAKRSIAFFLCVAIPALVAPHFVSGLLTAVRMVNATEEYTFEWHPSWRYLFVGSIPAHFLAGLFPTLVVLVWSLPVGRGVRALIEGGRTALSEFAERCPPHQLGVALVMLLECHRSLRFVYMAAFALLILWPSIEGAFDLGAISERVKNGALAAALAILVLVTYQSRVLFLYGSLGQAIAEVTGDSPLQEGHYPIGAADFLVKTGFEGRIFAQAKIGGYLLYRLYPRALVLADGRGNYSEATTVDLRRAGNSQNFKDPGLGPEIQAIYERYPIDAVVTMELVWPNGYAPAAGWVGLYEDDRSKVWIRCTERGSAYLDRLFVDRPNPCKKPG